MINPRPNPYVGPRSFNPGETLYGRDRETLDLLDLLTAERIVLLYSPSGAGKTSLIHAALLPRLRQKGFNVLRPMRVNQEPPTELAALNRYVASALLSLEEALPPAQRTPLAQLASLTFSSYLDHLMETQPARQALVFDQFEEILTVDPTNVKDKSDFFAAVGQALENRKRWALFALREDYIAGLDPYARPIPTRFANTFRLDLLKSTAACEAIQKPAHQAGVEFADDAASKLVDDLRRVQVQRPDGTIEPQPGQYIEPVQLQVVCLRLWEHWEQQNPNATTITAADVTGIGDVNSALADYYASRVEQVAEATGERERTIREWFDRELITPGGIRGQVLMEPDKSRGLSNRAIRMFEDAHLVRAEARRGTTWFELAHDRLVEPIRTNNAAWFQSHLSALQRQAELWNGQNRREGFLLNGQALVEAEEWAQAHAAELTQTEKDFLQDCREARAEAERDQRQNERIRWLAIGATILSILALIAFVLAYYQFNQATAAAVIAQQNEAIAKEQRAVAEQQKNLAYSRQLAADAIANLSVDPERSILLAMNAISVTAIPANQVALHQSIVGSLLRLTLRGHTDKVNNASYSPDGSHIITPSWDNTAILWDAHTGAPVAVLRGHTGPVWNALFSLDGKRIATVSADKTARIWDATTGQLQSVLSGHTDEVFVAVFTPDSRQVITASYDKTVRLWDAATGAQLQVLTGAQDRLFALAVSPDGKLVAAVGNENTVHIWDLTTGAEVRTLTGHTAPIRDVKFSPDSKHLATSGDDQTARVWDVASGRQLFALRGHRGTVSRVEFSPDGKQLTTCSSDQTARVWDASNGRLLSTLQGHTNWVWTVAYSRDSKKIVTSSGDQTARVWDAATGRELGVLRGHTDMVGSAQFSPDGNSVLTASYDGTARVWQVPPGREALALVGHTNTVFDVDYSPDGKRIVTGSNDGTARVWDARSGQPLLTLSGHSAEVWSARYSPDGKRIVTASSDNTAMIWDAGTGASLRVLKGNEERVWSAGFSPDGTRVVTGGDDGYIRIFDAADGSSLAVWDQNAPIFHVTFFPDGQRVLICSRDGIGHIWDIATGHEVAALKGHTGVLINAEFSRDGSRIVTASYDHTAMIWDAKTLQPLATLQGHTNWVRSAAFSPDGKQIVTTSDDATVRFWDATTGQEIAALPVGISTNVAYSPDGTRIVTAQDNWMGAVYFTGIDDLVALARSRVTRDLTCEERVAYLSETRTCR